MGADDQHNPTASLGDLRDGGVSHRSRPYRVTPERQRRSGPVSAREATGMSPGQRPLRGGATMAREMDYGSGPEYRTPPPEPGRPTGEYTRDVGASRMPEREVRRRPETKTFL